MFGDRRITVSRSWMELRRCPRFPALFEGTVLYRNQSHAITKSVDLSRTGCRLKSAVCLVAGMTVDLLLYIPGEEIPLLVQSATVRWSDIRGIGLEFQTQPSHHQSRLDRVVRRLEIETYN